MTIDEVSQALTAMGCKEYPSHSAVERTFVYRRTRGPDCECNDRPPDVHIDLYPDTHSPQGGIIEGTATITVIAEMKSTWCDLGLYAMSREDVIKKLPIAYQALEAAWMACAIVLSTME